MTLPTTISLPAFDDRAACAGIDPERFFPSDGRTPWPAKRVCAGCPAREACLQYALATDTREGVWGGLTGEERSKLPRQQPTAPVVVAAAAQRPPSIDTTPETAAWRREQVKEMTAAGKTSREIARALGVSQTTVSRHRAATREAS